MTYHHPDTNSRKTDERGSEGTQVEQVPIDQIHPNRENQKDYRGQPISGDAEQQRYSKTGFYRIPVSRNVANDHYRYQGKKSGKVTES